MTKPEDVSGGSARNNNGGGTISSSGNANGGNSNSGNRNNSNKRKNKGNSQLTKIPAHLKGEIESLGNHVFVVGSSLQADAFTGTKKAIVEYAGRVLTHYPQDITSMMNSNTETRFLDPPYPAEEVVTKYNREGKTFQVREVPASQLKIWEKKVDRIIQRKEHYESNKHRVFNIIMGQCTPSVRAKVESNADFTTYRDRSDVLELLNLIKNIAFKGESKRSPKVSSVMALRSLLNLKQQEDEHISDFYKRWNNQFDVVSGIYGSLESTVASARVENDGTLTDREKAAKKSSETESLKGVMFLLATDRKKYGRLIDDLANTYAGTKTDPYPVSVADALERLDSFQNPDRFMERKLNKSRNNSTNNGNSSSTRSSGVAFSQGNTGKGGGGKKGPVCWHCNEPGHVKSKCPKLGQSHAQEQASQEIERQLSFAQLSNCFAQSKGVCSNAMEFAFRSGLSKDMRLWLLLDSESTADIFCNKALLSNVREVDDQLDLHTNGGVLITKEKGYLKNYGDVWVNEKAMTNILALCNVRRKYRVTYDSEDGNVFKVYKTDGKVMIFKEAKNGLFYHAIGHEEFCMVHTVEENKQRFSERQFQRAKLAREVYHMVGAPSIKDYMNMVRFNLLKNCPVTLEDIRLSQKIFGKDVATLKGKGVRKQASAVIEDVVEVPQDLIEAHKYVTLCVDIMFVQGLAFLVTISIDLKFRTVEYLPSRTSRDIYAALDNVFRKYNKGGFEIRIVRTDPEFTSIEEEVMDKNNIRLNPAAAEAHVHEIERSNRTTKERVRVQYHRLPYDRMPKWMWIKLVEVVIKWLNAFPIKGGISPYLSPRSIVTGRPMDYNKQCVATFGQYVLASTDTKARNSNKARRLDCIYLKPMENDQGGHELMDLTSRQVITRHDFDVVPVTPGVIRRVEELADKDGISSELTILDRSKRPIDDGTWTAGVDTIQNQEIEPEDDPEESDSYDEPDVPDEQEDLYDEEVNEDQESHSEDENVTEMLNEVSGDVPVPQEEVAEDVAEPQEPVILNEPVVEVEEQPIRPVRRSARSVITPERLNPTFKGQSYMEMHKKIEDLSAPILLDDDMLRVGVNYINYLNTEEGLASLEEKGMCFTEYSLKAAINKFGERGRKAGYEEMEQLHKRKAFEPIYPREITLENRRQVMESLIFIKHKRDDRLKGRTCANGSIQRAWIPKEDTAAPTASLEAVFLTAVIDAKEGRDVATIDIPNAFIQTDMDNDHTYMKVRGPIAELLCEVDPELYKPFLYYENNKPVIYLRVLKAIYGTLRGALLYYQRFRADIEKLGFEVNPYDPCVANMELDGSQCTLVWHVDDIKASHKNPKVLDRVIMMLGNIYSNEDIGKMKPVRGKKHDYLGMVLDYSNPGEVIIDMTRYVKQMVEEFPYQNLIKGTAATPAANHLFNVRDNVPKLEERRRKVFHNMVAKGLFVCRRSRPDIQTTIAFLTTRVKEPDEDDWKKLLRLMMYLKDTQSLTMVLSAVGEYIPRWLIDAAFGVHKDMKSHTGGCLTMGKGAIQSMSSKQKMNTKSSTEAELVAADDVSGQIIWTRYFLEAQGFGIKDNILYQDNQSAMLLEKNGLSSAGKRSRHLNVRLFYITDRIKRGELRVEYCPTDEMVGDFFTKPLQGAKFRLFRDIILGLKAFNPPVVHRSVLGKVKSVTYEDSTNEHVDGEVENTNDPACKEDGWTLVERRRASRKTRER